MNRLVRVKPEIFQKDNMNEPVLDGNGEPVLVWEGWLEIEIPPVEKQTELKAKAMSWNKKDGSFDTTESNRYMHELASSQLKACELKHIETGTTINSPDELQLLDEYEDIRVHVYRVCSRGPKLRNILKTE